MSSVGNIHGNNASFKRLSSSTFHNSNLMTTNYIQAENLVVQADIGTKSLVSNFSLQSQPYDSYQWLEIDTFGTNSNNTDTTKPVNTVNGTGTPATCNITYAGVPGTDSANPLIIQQPYFEPLDPPQMGTQFTTGVILANDSSGCQIKVTLVSDDDSSIMVWDLEDRGTAVDGQIVTFPSPNGGTSAKLTLQDFTQTGSINNITNSNPSSAVFYEGDFLKCIEANSLLVVTTLKNNSSAKPKTAMILNPGTMEDGRVYSCVLLRDQTVTINITYNEYENPLYSEYYIESAFLSSNGTNWSNNESCLIPLNNTNAGCTMKLTFQRFLTTVVYSQPGFIQGQLVACIGRPNLTCIITNVISTGEASEVYIASYDTQQIVNGYIEFEGASGRQLIIDFEDLDPKVNPKTTATGLITNKLVNTLDTVKQNASTMFPNSGLALIDSNTGYGAHLIAGKASTNQSDFYISPVNYSADGPFSNNWMRFIAQSNKYQEWYANYDKAYIGKIPANTADGQASQLKIRSQTQFDNGTGSCDVDVEGKVQCNNFSVHAPSNLNNWQLNCRSDEFGNDCGFFRFTDEFVFQMRDDSNNLVIQMFGLQGDIQSTGKITVQNDVIFSNNTSLTQSLADLQSTYSSHTDALDLLRSRVTVLEGQDSILGRLQALEQKFNALTN